jgi:hypothetical protein
MSQVGKINHHSGANPASDIKVFAVVREHAKLAAIT